MQKINELQLAKELIRFPSVTPVDAGVMKFLEKKLKKLGFKTKLLEFKEKDFKPVKNLYARLGRKGPNFCYAGHLDVCLLYTSPSPRDLSTSRMPSSA